MGTKVLLSMEQLRQMQLLELDMLIEFDRVCRANNIDYRISSGTMLGAVRHGGFIPWDDDADISMLRENYEKFKLVAHQMNPEICYFQDNTTDPEYRWGYGKLRRTGTRYVRLGQDHLKCKTGIFVDVFVLDDVPANPLAQVFQDCYCFILRKIMYSEVGKCSSSEKWLPRQVYKLMSHIPIKFVFNRLRLFTDRSRNDSNLNVRVLVSPLKKNSRRWGHYGAPREENINMIDIDFEGYPLRIPAVYDKYLKRCYGDYMKVPDPDKRGQNSPCSEIDFGNAVPVYKKE